MAAAVVSILAGTVVLYPRLSELVQKYPQIAAVILLFSLLGYGILLIGYIEGGQAGVG